MRKLMMNGVDIAENLLAFAQELVRIKSYSDQEEQVVRHIASKMETLGFDEVKLKKLNCRPSSSLQFKWTAQVRRICSLLTKHI
jgi:hypothetical protein